MKRLLESTLGEDCEKAVLWFGSGPPCLLCLWLPVNQNTNLTADRIPPISALCLLTYCDNNLSQFFIRFFFFFDPSSGTVGVYLSDYGLFIPLSIKLLVFRDAGHHLYTYKRIVCSVSFLSIHLALATTGDSGPHALVHVYTHIHTHRHARTHTRTDARTCDFQFVLIVL